MKHIKNRLLLVLLVLVTVLTLLPTTAMAATSTGTGIKATTNSNYWTTRLLTDGTPYSYRPPVAAGKTLYCCDRGYGYRWGTESFLNSYTYTSATGADADEVLKNALALSGLGELDAQQLENVKWMMTYIVDYKGEIPGSLFMALQTYIWDNQTYKGGGDGDIDAGGYANADTYETYLGYIDWMLGQKANEDAAYAKQIEEYAAQGKVATVVEDDSAKWAVYARSSVQGRQSFFNYYAPRKLVVTPAETGTPEEPPAGDADITLKKVAAGTTRGLAGARFLIYRDGQIIGSDVTNSQGIIEVNDVTKGLWSFVETDAPDGYCADHTPISVYVDTTDGDKQYTVTAENYALPSMKIIKTDAQTGALVPGTVFSIKSVTGSYSTSVTVGGDGTATLEDMDAGVYVVREESVPEPYVVSNTEQTVALRPGKTSEVHFQDYQKPGLEILKKNIANGDPIEGVTYKIEQIDGDYSTSATTDSTGRIYLENIPVGSYKITEVNVPDYVILSEVPQTVSLEAGCSRTVTFFNALKPSLTILKRNSVTTEPLENAKFHIYYASDNTDTGEINDLGVYYSDADGKIMLTDVNRGWYKIVEEAAPDGYSIQGDGVMEFYLEANTSKTVTVDNVPLNAIIVEKYDSVTGEVLPGCTFQLRYLSGTSGTGGTVIGQKPTGKTGTVTWTGLSAGTYIVEEVDPADGYSIIQSSETVFLADSGEQSVITVRFENAPDGILLIRKVCSVNPSVTLQNAEFKVMYADGQFIGDSNGIYRTDENGEIRITGLKPGKSVIVTETRAPDGFILDTQSQTIQIKEGRTVSLTFKNQPKGQLIVQKRDSATGQPLPGAEFKVTTAAGCEVGLDGVIGDSTLTQNGIFTTDSNGEFRITNLMPGAYVVTEVKAPYGYVMDTPSTNVVIGSKGDTQTVVIKNSKAGTLVINKKDSLTGKPLEGVTFKVTTSTGEYVPDENGKISSNGLYVTDKDGQIVINGVVGTVVVTETKTIPGYSIDPGTKTQTVDVRPNDTQSLTFYNTPSTTLVIEKYIEGTDNEPLEGVTFLVTDSSGAVVGTSNGEYVTDEAGRIVITGLEPGMTVTARETRTVEGFVLDGTPKSILIKEGEVQTLRFYNRQQGTLVIRKLDSVTKEPLPGVEFELTYAEGGYVDDANGHLSSKGLYTTGSNGEIRISGITGTIVAKETKPIEGYTIDPEYQTQTVVVNAADTQTLTFYNTPVGVFQLIKIDEDSGERVSNCTFEIRRMDDGLVGTYTTDKNGTFSVPLDAGSYYAVEIKSNSDYRLDDTPHYFEMKDGESTVLRITNKRLSGIIIHKIDSQTEEGIYGVKFVLYDSNKKPIGEYTTDDEGYIYIDDIPGGLSGRFYLRELEAADGYILDKEYKTVNVKPGKTVEIEWENTAVTGQIQIYKYAAEYNTVTGTAPGTPLQGAVYEIINARSGKVVDYITTDARGVAASKPLPLTRYQIREVTAPAYWQVDSTVHDVTLEYAGQIIKLSAYDKAASLGVSITKRGNAEVLAGSQMRYNITVANTSNVPLENYFWHDRIPTDVARATVLTTGTYSARLNYRILYKTNYSANYQVLASNLLTSNNYSFALNAIPMQAGEVVTDIYFDFGTVPVGFQSVTGPTLSVMVNGTAVNGYQMVNRADVGGKYQGTWQTAQANWVTIIRKLGNTPTLPKTGY